MLLRSPLGRSQRERYTGWASFPWRSRRHLNSEPSPVEAARDGIRRRPKSGDRAGIRFWPARPAPCSGARDLVERRVDILFALSPIAVQAAKDATKTVPIVMLLIYSDPVELGFVASFARPGGNITGVVLAAEPTMAGKRLELLKEAVPGPTRIALLVTTETYSRTQVQWAEKVAPSLGVKLVVVEVRGADYDRAFARRHDRR